MQKSQTFGKEDENELSSALVPRNCQEESKNSTYHMNGDTFANKKMRPV